MPFYKILLLLKHFQNSNKILIKVCKWRNGINYFTFELTPEAGTVSCCELMARSEFADGCNFLAVKDRHRRLRCSGLKPGLNLRDSGLDVSYALRDAAIAEKRASFKRVLRMALKVGNYQELIPDC